MSIHNSIASHLINYVVGMPSIVNLMHLFMFNVKRNERAKVFHKHTYFEKGFSLHTLMGIMGSVGGSLAIRQTN